jgi:hypothetical protein
MQHSVPELSLADYTHGGAASRDAFCSELMRGLQRFGFIILRDHAVSMILRYLQMPIPTAGVLLPMKTSTC